MEDFILTVCHIFQLLAAAYGLYFAAVSLFLLKRDNRAVKSAGVNSVALLPILVFDNRLSRLRLAL